MLKDMTIKIQRDDQDLLVSSSDDETAVNNNEGSKDENKKMMKMNKVSFILKPSKEEVLRQKVIERFSKGIRDIKNKNRALIAAKMLSHSQTRQKELNIPDFYSIAKTRRKSMEEVKRQKDEASFVRWD